MADIRVLLLDLSIELVYGEVVRLQFRYGQDTFMKYLGILVALGLITSVVGLSLAQAAITLPQKIKISANTKGQQTVRVKRTKSLPPIPTIAPIQRTQMSTKLVAITPSLMPSLTPSPFPTSTPVPTLTPTKRPEPTKTPPTPTPNSQPQPTSASVRIIPTSSSVSRQALQDATNDYRKQAGKSSLSERDDLCALAETRAREISQSFDHSGFRSRIDSGELKVLNYKAVAENIWHGAGDATRIVKDWSESTGHNKNLLEDWQWGCGAHVDGYAAYLYLR
jgi:uncharacterized protein YkwD